MTKRVHVIAAFNDLGEIRPLWFKLSLDKNAPDYKILSCTRRGAESWYGIITFRCEVIVYGKRQEIGLNYSVSGHYWDLVINNSSISNWT